jgi:beta-glucosidase
LLDEKPKRSTVELMAPSHIETARKIAESACVLLKNEKQALPIDASKVKTIAVIGANAQAKFANDGMSAAIKTKYEVTPLEGITKRAGEKVEVKFATGFPLIRGGGARRGGAAPAANNQAMIDEAVALAKTSDVVVVVAGLNRALDQEAADRPNMELPAGQAELISAVAKANPKTVVVLNGGSPSNVNPWITDVAGLVMYWYGGTEGGNGLARVLFGDVNPAGHLPCSWPKELKDSPAHNAGDANQYPGVGRAGRGGGLTAETGPQQVYSEGLYVGYRWFDSKKIEPQFPFGYGLSYTSFAMSDLKVDGGADGNASVTVKVANTGSRQGAEVVQVYVAPVKASVDRPMKELKAFGKIDLASGANGTVSMKLDPSAFAFYDVAKHAWVAEAGEYTVLAGDSAANTPLKATVKIEKTIVIPEGK